MSLSEIRFNVGGHLIGASDSVLLGEGDNAYDDLIQAIVNSIATDVEIEIGGVKIHLAGLLDPRHWSEDWEEAARAGGWEPTEEDDEFDAEEFLVDLLNDNLRPYETPKPKDA